MAKQKASRQPKPAAAPPPDRQAFPTLWLIALLGLTGLVFAPMLHNQFTNWDDEAYVVNNMLLRGPDWAGIFTQPLVSNYHPLTVLSLALNYQLSGLNPFSYLLLNWSLHLLNTGLVFYFVWLLSGRLPWVALFTAAVFALHPMHIESVAWVSERKDLLYTCFFLLGLLRYWRYLSDGRRSHYWLCFGFFLLSLLSKPAAVVFPLSLLLLDAWQGRPWDRKLLLEKLPFFLFALAFGVLTFMIQSEKGIVSLAKYSLLDRFFFGCYCLLMYVVRFFWPSPLSAFHPYPAPGALGPFIQAAPLLCLLAGAGLWYFRKNKALLFGMLFYVANIILVVQFVAIGNTLLSERYTYVPYIGLAFALAMTLAQSPWRALQWPLLGFTALVLGFLSWRHIPVWKNSETLWSDVIAQYPDAPIPHANRANHRYHQALLPAKASQAATLMEQALGDCNAALLSQPNHFASLDIRSILFIRNGKYDEALADAGRMVQLEPDNKKGYLNRASALERLKRYDESLDDYSRCLDFEPNNADALNGRGTVRFNGKQQYREALPILTGRSPSRRRAATTSTARAAILCSATSRKRLPMPDRRSNWALWWQKTTWIC
ncbi:MAG: hypothetical protein IT260_09030 [Saprospiraceae bacterium]|nr:hypothetical protein [Saprospiraceae bacterium]